MKFSDTGQVQLYVRSMGKLLRVTAAFESVDEANRYMETHRDEGVVAEIKTTILLANLHDRGLKIQTCSFSRSGQAPQCRGV